MRLGLGLVAAAEIATAAIAAAGCGKWADDLACGKHGCLFTDDAWSRVASLAGIADAAPPPDPSNAYEDRPAAIALGHQLYFEPRLSGVSTWKDTLGRPAPNPRTPAKGDPLSISCATCHDPARYGSDFTSLPGNVSTGAGWYDVNGQQTLNAAFFSIFYWNGRTDTLWAQAAQVIESPVSMNGDRLNTFWVIASLYRDAYSAVFCTNPDGSARDAAPGCPLPPASALADTSVFAAHGKPTDPTQLTFVSQVQANVGKAIAAYERTLRTLDSPFDRYVKAGGPGSTELAPAAERGLALFIGKASCIDCHNTPLFSDQKFHDIGIAQPGGVVPTVATCLGAPATPDCDCTGTDGVVGKCLPWGAYTGAIKRRSEEFQRRDYGDAPAAGLDGGIAADAGTALGPCELAGDSGAPVPDPRCKGAWRTPSLRDVAMTAPYMHDGLFTTLSEVVWHYDQAEGAGTELFPLDLSNQDRDDLVAFLGSLTSDQPAVAAKPPALPEGTVGPAAATAAVMAMTGATTATTTTTTTVPARGPAAKVRR
jgi:cytochrome c peroxidase